MSIGCCVYRIEQKMLLSLDCVALHCYWWVYFIWVDFWEVARLKSCKLCTWKLREDDFVQGGWFNQAQIYNGRSLTANILKIIFYGEYPIAIVRGDWFSWIKTVIQQLYPSADILWQTSYGKYPKAHILWQIFYSIYPVDIVQGGWLSWGKTVIKRNVFPKV